MENNISFIHSETDLQNATDAATQRVEQQQRLLQDETKAFPGTIKKEVVRKTLPWIIGAGTAVVAVILIRKWVRHSTTNPDVKEEQVATPEVTKFQSLALKLLPFATIVLKNWLSKKKPVSEGEPV